MTKNSVLTTELSHKLAVSLFEQKTRHAYNYI
nr:MAG TPA: hypothetical protein [Caudoviricetes sp.]